MQRYFPTCPEQKAFAHIDVHIRTIFLYNRILMYIIISSVFSSKYDVRVTEIEVVPENWFKTNMINWNLFFKFLPRFLSENCILLLHLSWQAIFSINLSTEY